MGAAWVFTRSGGTWTQQGAKLTGGGETGNGSFGCSVALSADGNTALIGAPATTTVGAAWVFTPALAAGLYWTNGGGSAFGRANVDGSGADRASSPAQPPAWGRGRRPLPLLGQQRQRHDRAGEPATARAPTRASSPAPAPRSGWRSTAQHVYWANSGTGTIGRANLDGTGVNQSFITGAGSPAGVAVDGQHVYWANSGNGTIGRANLDGTGVDQSFITGASPPAGVAVDASTVYWANGGSGTIGRANLDGTGVNQSFVSGASGPRGVAVDGPHLYWANSGSGTIGRANLNGWRADQGFVTGADQPRGFAVLLTVPAPPTGVSAGPGTARRR